MKVSYFQIQSETACRQPLIDTDADVRHHGMASLQVDERRDV